MECTFVNDTYFICKKNATQPDYINDIDLGVFTV